MKSARRVWAWLTFLLFIGGVASPHRLAAMPADCPMVPAERERLSPASPAPVKTYTCYEETSAAKRGRAETVSRPCCCDLTAAPERSDNAPAILPAPVTPDAVLPSAIIRSATPRTAPITAIYSAQRRDTAPRAPPIRSTPPRAPPPL